MAVRDRINEAMYGVALSQEIRRELGQEAEARWRNLAPTGYAGTAKMPRRSRFGRRILAERGNRVPTNVGPGGLEQRQFTQQPRGQRKPAQRILTGVEEAQAERQGGIPPVAMSGITQAVFDRKRREASRLTKLARQVMEGEQPDIEPWEEERVDQILAGFETSLEEEMLSPDELRKKERDVFYDRFQEMMNQGQDFDDFQSYLDFGESLLPEDATAETVKFADKVLEEFMPKKLREQKAEQEAEQAYEKRRQSAIERWNRDRDEVGPNAYYDDRLGRVVEETPKIDEETKAAQAKKTRNKTAVAELEAKPNPKDWAIVDMDPAPDKYKPQVVPLDFVGSAILKGQDIVGYYEEVKIDGWTHPRERELRRSTGPATRNREEYVTLHVPSLGYTTLPRWRAEAILEKEPKAKIITDALPSL
jgi:hypothetical protein